MGIKERKLTDGRTRYEAESRAGGRTKSLGTHDTRQAALDAIADWETDVRRYRAAVAAGDNPTPLHGETFEQVVDEYIAHLQTPGVKSYRSRAKYEQQLRLHAVPHWERTLISTITQDDVAEWHVSLTAKEAAATHSAKGALLSAASANTAKIALSAMFKWAKRKRYVTANPCSEVADLTYRKHDYQWIQTPEAISKLVATCGVGTGRNEHSDGLATDLRDFVAIDVATGLRANELLYLDWLDVNWRTRQIRVRRGKSGTTKTDRERMVPLLDTALAAIRDRWLRAGQPVSGLVFPGQRNPKQPRQLDTLHYPFKRAIQRAEIHIDGMPEIRIHDLRHTFASHWVSNGGDIFRLSKVLGHATVRTTEEYYAHLSPGAWEVDYQRVSFKLPPAEGAATATVTAIRSV